MSDETCTNCDGYGDVVVRVLPGGTGSIYTPDVETGPCPVCGGTGRVGQADGDES